MTNFDRCIRAIRMVVGSNSATHSTDEIPTLADACTDMPAPRHLVLAPRLVAALVAIYLLWGTSYLAIKQAGVEFPPLLLVGLRNLIAGIFLLCLALFQSRPLGSLRCWTNAAIVGVLMISVGAALLATGIQHVNSGSAAILFAAVPIIVCVLMAAIGQRISWAQWLGTAIGMCGLLLLNNISLSSPGQQGMWLIMAAAVVTGASAVLTDCATMPEDFIVSTGIQMMVGGGVASLLGWLFGERISSLSVQALAAFLYLSLFVSVIGYVSYMYLMTRAGAVVASSYAYVNPPIALLAGAWLLNEQISPLTTLAAGVVLTGAVTVLVATPQRAPNTTAVAALRKGKTS